MVEEVTSLQVGQGGCKGGAGGREGRGGGGAPHLGGRRGGGGAGQAKPGIGPRRINYLMSIFKEHSVHTVTPQSDIHKKGKFNKK